MSRSRTRERQRRQRLLERLRDAVNWARDADAEAALLPSSRFEHGELWRLLCAIERKGLCVWDVARAVRCTDDELAMIARVVAPDLT